MESTGAFLIFSIIYQLRFKKNEYYEIMNKLMGTKYYPENNNFMIKINPAKKVLTASMIILKYR